MQTKPKKAKRASSGVRLRPPRAGRSLSEKQIPVRAREALAAAARRAKKARLCTVEIDHDKMVIVASDGKRTFVKAVEPAVTVKIGQKITIRRD